MRESRISVMAPWQRCMAGVSAWAHSTTCVNKWGDRGGGSKGAASHSPNASYATRTRSNVPLVSDPYAHTPMQPMQPMQPMCQHVSAPILQAAHTSGLPTSSSSCT